MNAHQEDMRQQAMDRYLAARDHKTEFLRHHPEYLVAPAAVEPAQSSDVLLEPQEPPLLGFTPWQIVAMAAVVALSCFASSVWKMGWAA